MPLTRADFAAFEAFVAEPDIKRERECQGYLQHADELLLGQKPLGATLVTEVRSYVGDADVFVIGDIISDTNHKERVAFVWELKAPQCHLFEYDNNANRCRPTDDFIKAENQLLHYANEAQNNNNTRIRLGVIRSTDIRVGGIIIGTQARFLKGTTDPREVQKAEMALSLRREVLYKPHGIRVLTWDRVLDAVRPI